MTPTSSQTKGRLAVVCTTYHQPADGEPTAVDSRFARILASDEQPYRRQVKVGEDWQAIDSGWITDAGMLVIENNEGRFYQVQPSLREREDSLHRIVEVAAVPTLPPSESRGAPAPPAEVLLTPAWVVLPGESLRAHPLDLSALRVRSRFGVAKVTVTVFPE